MLGKQTKENSGLPNDFEKNGERTMGGSASGRKPDWLSRNTTDDYPRLDVNFLKREGMLDTGSFRSVHWSVEETVTGSINIKAENGRIVLSYRYRRGDGEWEDICQSVTLKTTPCRLGGRRYWFLCPGEGCGRRVGVLYGARYFLCRHCLGAAYASQTEDKIDRLARKACKIRHRLGWPGGVRSPPGYLKPKGMHWRTFSRLCLEHRRLEYLVDLNFIAKYRKKL